MKEMIGNQSAGLRIWSHLLKKCLMENFIFCAMNEDDIDIHFML